MNLKYKKENEQNEGFNYITHMNSILAYSSKNPNYEDNLRSRDLVKNKKLKNKGIKNV